MVMDKDGDGRIDLNEWVYGKTASKLRTNEEVLKEEYEKLKTDKSKSNLTSNELRKSLGNVLSEDEKLDEKIDDIMDEIDLDDKGNISFETFRNAMRSQTVRD